ncbi:serine hydrolase [Mesorhizobium sp. AR02]|uniref:serine hydrolase n=1 Tax=Mesorhizobium sp. AR02 TaxID=2865837 RepID=UPI0021603BDA|nr:serine hydrolase [Mesorhizobium sp. AR02]UVK54002.1 serine hydrolase [Mesorhizobium sp. AR02]
MTKANSRERNSSLPSDLEIARILAERVGEHRQAMGVVVGIVEPQGRRIFAQGRFCEDDPRSVDGNTVFEIGSITKVFTTLLLADMANKGELKLDDPVAMHLPPEVSVPQRNGKAITLADLATHMSSLPRLPDNMAPENDADPYADYTVEQLYQFLSAHQLAHDIGTRHEYSNVGFGLLGHVLARRAGTDYESLIRDRIAGPLGMESTAIALSPALAVRLAHGHEWGLRPVSNWTLPTLAGAGALRSTAGDLLTFVEAALGNASLLTAAFDLTLKTRRSIGADNVQMGLGWMITKRGDEEMIWHNGGTGGYCSFLGFLPKSRRGVVVLSNTVTEFVDNSGQHLLDPTIVLAAPPKRHIEVSVDPRLYDNYVGKYQLTPEAIIDVSRDGDGLLVQLTGQEQYEIFPEGERDFFLKIVNAQITFEGTGRAEGLTLYQAGQQLPAPRIE